MKRPLMLLTLLIAVIALAPISSVKSENSSPEQTGETALTHVTLWNSTANGLARAVVLGNGEIYIGLQDGGIFSINSTTGEKLWNYSTYTGDSLAIYAPYAPSLTLSNDVLYIGSFNGVYALNAYTGTVLWKNPIAPVYATPYVTDGIVFIGCSDNSVYAFNATNGIQLWHCILGSSYWLVLSSPVLVNGVVYIGSDDHYIYAINASTGNQIWYHDAGNWIDASPRVVNDVLYIMDNAGDGFALNATNGDALGINGNTVEDIFGGTYAIVGGQEVFIGSPLWGSVLYSLNAFNYSQSWSNYLGEIVPSPPIIVGGTVFVVGGGVSGDILYALDAADGQAFWSYPLWTDSNGGTSLQFFGYASGILYVVPLGGDLYAYNISSILPSNSYLHLSILLPSNEKYNESNVNVTFTLSNPENGIDYSLDGEMNNSVSGNFTLANLTDGVHSITIYAMDTFGNTAAQSTNFSVNQRAESSANIQISVQILLIIAFAVVIIALVSLLFYRKHREAAKLESG